jgi:hypothetical protein
MQAATLMAACRHDVIQCKGLLFCELMHKAILCRAQVLADLCLLRFYLNATAPERCVSGDKLVRGNGSATTSNHTGRQALLSKVDFSAKVPPRAVQDWPVNAVVVESAVAFSARPFVHTPDKAKARVTSQCCTHTSISAHAKIACQEKKTYKTF